MVKLLCDLQLILDHTSRTCNSGTVAVCRPTDHTALCARSSSTFRAGGPMVVPSASTSYPNTFRFRRRVGHLCVP